MRRDRQFGATDATPAEVVDRGEGITIESGQPAADEPQELKLSTIEKNAILKVIEKHNGNISKAAKELGLTRTALYRRLSKYDI